MKSIVLIILALSLIVGGSYLLSPRRALPMIAITSPSGGEVWHAGESHPITWESEGIPAEDKFSITIRRIPPPPLQTEGQEFDPIIFTNLSNKGSIRWRISSMYPDGTYVLGISAYNSIPVTDPITSESAPFTLLHPKLAVDLYPLYSNANWAMSQSENFLIGSTSFNGASVSSAPISVGMNPSSVITSFEKYYANKLRALGWNVVNDLAAGGHVGGQTGYRKDGNTILTRFRIDYSIKPENAPSECPCDVTLSLFSSVQ